MIKPRFSGAYIGAVGAMVALAACETLPDGRQITPELRRDYLEAVASVGCVLRDERQFGAVDFQAGLTREETLAITAGYLSRGRAERLADGKTIRIKAGPCAT